MAFTDKELKKLAKDDRAGSEYADDHMVECPTCEGDGCDRCGGYGVFCPNETPCAFCAEWTKEEDDE